MAGADTYFASFSPEEQQRIRDSWGGANLLNEWFQNAVNAGAVGADGTVGSRQGSYGGAYAGPNDAEAQGYNYSQGVSGPSGLQAGATPTPKQLRQYAKEQGWSEDFNRYSDAQVQAWINNSWDPGGMKFRSEADGSSLMEKPTETPQGWQAFGSGYRQIPAGWGEGGGGGGGSSWAAGGGIPSGVPEFKWEKFEAPKLTEDPGFKFRLNEGVDALEGSAAAAGTLRSGGTLKDIMSFGQDLASQEYANAFNRANQGWQNNFQGAQAAFAPRYGAWQTGFNANENRWQTGQNADLQKYLQRENNIFGLLSQAPPGWGGGGGY